MFAILTTRTLLKLPICHFWCSWTNALLLPVIPEWAGVMRNRLGGSLCPDHVFVNVCVAEAVCPYVVRFMTGICLPCPAAWLLLIRRSQSAAGSAPAQTHIHSHTHDLRADTGCPTKAGLSLLSPQGGVLNHPTTLHANTYTSPIQPQCLSSLFHCFRTHFHVFQALYDQTAPNEVNYILSKK